MNKNKSSEKIHNFYPLLEKKLEEISFPAPQDLGFATGVYKKVTAPLKTAPWKILLPVSFLVSVAVWQIMGKLFVRLVSVLQAAF